jgi:hypothetical protein
MHSIHNADLIYMKKYYKLEYIYMLNTSIALFVARFL